MSFNYHEIKKLKAGDIVYECCDGINVELRILNAPEVSFSVDGREVLRLRAENTQDSSAIELIIVDGLTHYGPRLYREPQYCSITNGNVVFNLHGAK